jgi:hypothetical protein
LFAVENADIYREPQKRRHYIKQCVSRTSKDLRALLWPRETIWN